VFDDGAGPALYAGGLFQIAGDVTANRVARWDGKSWSALGEGMPGDIITRVNALTVFDDGTGPALYAGGYFAIAGEVEAHNIAQWDGRSWSALGSGTDTGRYLDTTVTALTPFDDGTGPALYAGGGFDTAGGAGSWHIGAWRGCAPAGGN
jgi:hypothetical protein